MPRDLATLQSDATDALDQVRKMALHTREQLLRFYAGASPDRRLFEPFQLGLVQYPDDIPSLREALTATGHSASPLAAVMRAQAALSAFLVDYDAGRLSALTVGAFRAHVERLFNDVGAATDAADVWLGTLNSPETPPQEAKASSRPNLALLDVLETLATEDVAKALGIGPEAARRRMRSGEFGPVTPAGRRNFVSAEGVRAALRREAPPPQG